MRNPILKNLKKISPIQFDLMGSVLIGISQTRKTLRAPALVSLKKTEYEKLLNYILTAATSFKHK